MAVSLRRCDCRYIYTFIIREDSIKSHPERKAARKTRSGRVQPGPVPRKGVPIIIQQRAGAALAIDLVTRAILPESPTNLNKASSNEVRISTAKVLNAACSSKNNIRRVQLYEVWRREMARYARYRAGM